MSRLLVALILTIGACAPAAATASAASPRMSGLDDRAPVYLALGDSIAVGDGASDREATAYVPLVHGALRGSTPCQPDTAVPCAELQLLNLAQGFATTTSLRESQLPAALEIIEHRNGDDDPGNDVVAITIDIGGFDTFMRLFRVCVIDVSPTCVRAIEQTLDGVGESLTAILTQLRDAAGPDTRIAVMTYFNSLLGCNLRAVAGTADLILEGEAGRTPGLNGVIRRAATEADVQVADTFGVLGPDDLVGGIDCLHPTDTGHAKIAQSFVTALVSPRANQPTF